MTAQRAITPAIYDGEDDSRLPDTRSSPALTEWTPSFVVSLEAAKEMVKRKREFLLHVMREGEHYGLVPGTDKPTLFKAGSEFLLSTMSLHSDSAIDVTPPVVDLMGTDHGGEAYVQYHKACAIYRQIGTEPHQRMEVARASANCNSWEVKYRWREGKRHCPECGAEAIIRGKREYGGGWICYGKKGGCGCKFADDDRRITEQQVGRTPNPDVADLVNTIEKIASKRAKVAATLDATGCSDLFTQDLDDADEKEELAAATNGAPPDGAAGYSDEGSEDPRDVSVGNTSPASPPPVQAQPRSEQASGGGQFPDMLVCPTCNKRAVIKGKAEYGGGFVCYRKKGGCGAKFTDESALGLHPANDPDQTAEAPSAPANGSPPPLTEAQAKELGELHNLLPLDLQMSGEERKKLVAEEGFERVKAALEARQDEALSRSASPQEEQPQQPELPS